MQCGQDQFWHKTFGDLLLASQLAHGARKKMPSRSSVLVMGVLLGSAAATRVGLAFGGG